MPDYFASPDRNTIIVREEFLLPDHLPDELLHRDRELQAIADSIKPLLTKQLSDNLFIHGPPGCGKTVCVKYLLKQLVEHSSAVLPVYVNCWENPTQLAVYNCIVEEMRLPLPRRGLATDEVFDRILQFIRNYKKPVLIVLDDMDGLKNEELLYVISRAKGFGIIAITNDKSLLASLDQRIRSSLRFSEMGFSGYTEEQLLSILRVRAEAALAPGTYDVRLLSKIASSVEGGSARMAIERLWKAAKHAEKTGKQKIMLQDFEDTVSSEPMFKLPELKLSPEELLIIELLRDGELESSAIYARFIKKMPKTKRQIRNYLESLEKKSLVLSRDLPSDGTLLRPKAFRLK